MIDDPSPATDKAAFRCPHCRAFTQQEWFLIFFDPTKQPPGHWTEESMLDAIDRMKQHAETENGSPPPDWFVNMVPKVKEGTPGLRDVNEPLYGSRQAWNMAASSCFVCKKVAVWLGGRMIYPYAASDIPIANEDLPSDIKYDYDEAAAVLNLSPRAASALLRLSIQKLCSFILGRSGDINEMIGQLVREGLDDRIRKALDIVRVIGNEAVHPGTMDLRDDKSSASQLFSLINIIADAMISQPKRIETLYATLPEAKLKGIEQRDSRSISGPSGSEKS